MRRHLIRYGFTLGTPLRGAVGQSRLLESASALIRRTTMALLVLGLGACANLDAVRGFGKTAAEITAYPDAGNAYRESAVTLEPYLVIAPMPSQRAVERDKQVKAARVLQQALTQYFALIAKLSGEDAFALDKQIEAIGKSLRNLPSESANQGTVDAGAGLAEALAKYAEAAAKERAVRDLVNEGGPSAMRLLDALRSVAGDWRAQVDGDRANVLNGLEILALAKDSGPLLKHLALDRAGELRRRYDTALQKFDTVDAALARVKSAHADMAAHVDDLSGPQVRQLLASAVGDLKAYQSTLDSLR